MTSKKPMTEDRRHFIDNYLQKESYSFVILPNLLPNSANRKYYKINIP